MRVSSTVLKVSCAPYNSNSLHIEVFIVNIALKQRTVPSLAVCCVPPSAPEYHNDGLAAPLILLDQKELIILINIK